MDCPWILRFTFGCSQPDSTPTNVCKRYIYAHVARCIFEGTYETDDNLFRGRKLGGGQPSYACFHSSQKCSQGVSSPVAPLSLFLSLSSTLFPIPFLSPFSYARPIKPSFAFCLRSYTLTLFFSSLREIEMNIPCPCWFLRVAFVLLWEKFADGRLYIRGI